MTEIKRFTGYQPVTETPRMMLPVGGYIAKILYAKVEAVGNNRQRILFYVEIEEGPYKGFYHQDYASRKGGLYEAKYRGIYNIAVPVGDGTKQDDYDIIRFNKALGAIENSNTGYHWDWRIEGLKGLVVGLSIRESEYRDVTFTEIGKLIPVSIIREGHFRPMRRRVSQDSPQSTMVTAPIPGTNQYMREQGLLPVSVQSLIKTEEELADAEDCPF